MLGKMKKGLCLLLVFVMLVTLVPSAAFAMEGEEPAIEPADAPTTIPGTFRWIWDGAAQNETEVADYVKNVANMRIPQIPGYRVVGHETAATFRFTPVRNFAPYIQGDPEGRFNANQVLTRSEVAVMLHNLAGNPAVPANAPTFSDVAPGRWYTNAVRYLAARGTITGLPDGTFAPNAPLLRAEIAAMLTRHAGVDITRPGNTQFTDVTSNQWFFNAVTQAADLNWVTGPGDGTFNPNNRTTRAEAVTMINRMDGRWATNIPAGTNHGFADVPANHWARNAIKAASMPHNCSWHTNTQTVTATNQDRIRGEGLNFNHASGLIGSNSVYLGPARDINVNTFRPPARMVQGINLNWPGAAQQVGNNAPTIRLDHITAVTFWTLEAIPGGGPGPGPGPDPQGMHFGQIAGWRSVLRTENWYWELAQEHGQRIPQHIRSTSGWILPGERIIEVFQLTNDPHNLGPIWEEATAPILNPIIVKTIAPHYDVDQVISPYPYTWNTITRQLTIFVDDVPLNGRSAETQVFYRVNSTPIPHQGYITRPNSLRKWHMQSFFGGVPGPAPDLVVHTDNYHARRFASPAAWHTHTSFDASLVNEDLMTLRYPQTGIFPGSYAGGAQNHMGLVQCVVTLRSLGYEPFVTQGNVWHSSTASRIFHLD